MNRLEETIARLRQRDESLETCQLSWKQIDDAKAERVARALDEHPTVASVDLSSNSIADDGAQHLALTLAAHPGITAMELYNNQIKDEGIQSIAEALKYNRTLTILDLQSNQIGSDGVAFLAEALLENTTLGYLDLGHNQIGNKGGRLLKQTLEINYIIAFLNLEGNQISPQIVSDIKELVDRNYNMQKKAATAALDPATTSSSSSPFDQLHGDSSQSKLLWPDRRKDKRPPLPRQGSVGDEPIQRKVQTLLPTLYFLMHCTSADPEDPVSNLLQQHTIQEKKVYAFFERNLWTNYFRFEYVENCPIELRQLLTSPFGDDQASNDFYYHIFLKLQSMIQACKIIYDNADSEFLQNSSNFARRQHGLFSPLDAIGSVFEKLSYYRSFTGQIGALHGVAILVKRANVHPGGLPRIVEHVARMATASEASRELVAKKENQEFDTQRRRLLRRLGCSESLTPLKEEGCFLAERVIECMFEPKYNGQIEALLSDQQYGRGKGFGVREALVADLLDLKIREVEELKYVLDGEDDDDDDNNDDGDGDEQKKGDGSFIIGGDFGGKRERYEETKEEITTGYDEIVLGTTDDHMIVAVMDDAFDMTGESSEASDQMSATPSTGVTTSDEQLWQWSSRDETALHEQREREQEQQYQQQHKVMESNTYGDDDDYNGFCPNEMEGEVVLTHSEAFMNGSGSSITASKDGSADHFVLGDTSDEDDDNTHESLIKDEENSRADYSNGQSADLFTRAPPADPKEHDTLLQERRPEEESSDKRQSSVRMGRPWRLCCFM